MNHDPDEARFDTAMRKRYATALAHPSVRTRTQLRQRLRIATTGQAASAKRARRHHSWALATAFAAALAIVVGLQLLPQRASQIASRPVAASADAAIETDNDAFDTLLDENPDFYLWLASVDAETLAME